MLRPRSFAGELIRQTVPEPVRGEVSLSFERALGVCCRARLGRVDDLAQSTTSTAEQPPLEDEQREARLKLLAERLRRPDGLDRSTLARIEQLADDDQ